MAFSDRLIAWHRLHGRHNLPWQDTRDPYRIWLSEIMLQQTRVETVVPYYLRFLARFPTVASLAAADQQDVLTLWSGLGYYARARNLHKAARIVVVEHGGCFPRNAAALALLPGVGRSTASAIAAFAFGERAAILDGNVKRVLCRIFGIDGYPGEKTVETRLWKLAESLLPESGGHDAIAVYTQAQMDLGATVCTRGRPACSSCPFNTACVAYLQDRCMELPEKKPRKAIPRRRVEMAVIAHDGRILLERRPSLGIWGGLLSLPEIPPDIEAAGWVSATMGAAVAVARRLPSFSHAFTHFVLDIDPWLLEIDRFPLCIRETGDSYVWLQRAEAMEAALPAPVRRILSALQEPAEN